MLRLIFTLDYEIHGNGDGNPMKLMVEPTYRLLSLIEKHGGRLTIFADMAEIMKFRDYYIEHNEDKFHFLEIKKQLQYAVMNGHDVQLHIHSSWFNAKFKKGKWHQSWEEYDFAGLEYEKIFNRISECKDLLENIIREKVQGYKCHVFRAANWAMQPTWNIVKALIGNKIYIDSSVYEYGKQNSWVNYDYSNIYSKDLPYKASAKDICSQDIKSLFWEFPIQCELQPIIYFLTPVRIFRMVRAYFHKHEQPEFTEKICQQHKSGFSRKFKDSLFRKHPSKFDFNQLNGRQMIRRIKTVRKNYTIGYITLIGHSKTFIWYNKFTLRRFLKYMDRNRNKYSFSLFPKKPE